jgi:spore germination protein GerM
VIVAGLAAGLAIVFFVLPRWLTSAPSTPAASTTAAPATADQRRLVATLYYVSEDGSSLVGVTRELPFGGTPAEQARSILAAELAPAPSGYVSPIPAGVSLRGVFLTPRGDAYADLSHEIITGHPGGSLNESLTVYAIVHALTQNVREITGVQILVDGKQVDTLAGHLDLRQPLAAEPRWVQKGP